MFLVICLLVGCTGCASQKIEPPVGSTFLVREGIVSISGEDGKLISRQRWDYDTGVRTLTCYFTVGGEVKFYMTVYDRAEILESPSSLIGAEITTLQGSPPVGGLIYLGNGGWRWCDQWRSDEKSGEWIPRETSS